ncbi:unnamed protein product [Macrosiphum euphorbiae]|nr:unnamed protein product [Macrosiphum euphorbiae]
MTDLYNNTIRRTSQLKAKGYQVEEMWSCKWRKHAEYKQMMQYPDDVIESLLSQLDSQVVLSWLTSSQQQFKTFVTNRLAKIVELLPMCNWRYVASQSNPADCVSRGFLPSQIIDHDLFWQGPPFLKTPESEWVVVCVNKLLPSHLPEYRSIMPKMCLASLVNVDVDWVTQFSSLKRMQRMVAFMLRFVNRARKLPIHDGPIQYTETEEAMLHIVRMTQRSYFANLFNTLKSPTSKVSPRSIAQLAPFVDKTILYV